LAASDTPEIESQGRKAAFEKRVVKRIDERVIHRPAELRVGMKDHGNRRTALLGGMKTAFQTASWTRENDFRHRDPQASEQP
jgi:hypothetical protein